MMPTIPLYEGTRPFQTLPFQWSLHTRDGDGNLRHQAFLADGAGDPRRRFTETLIDALAASNYPIIVYSPYERTQLKALARKFPDLSVRLDSVLARLADLLPIVRGAVYLPDFGFTKSLKSVAPALCPGFGYGDLVGVADGLAASSAFHQIASGAITSPDQLANLRVQLLAYCERDTLAMVEAHQALMQLKVPEVV
jgi:hypothetical protein